MSFGVEYRFEEKGGRSPAWLGYCLSVLMVGAASVVAVVVDHVIHIPNLSLVFVLPVVIAAVSFGWKPAMAAAAAAVVAEDYLLIDPRYTLSVADPANMWALGLLVVVAAIACSAIA